MQRTFSIIKPDAVKRNLLGTILQRFEEQGLKVIAAKMKQLTLDEAEAFYAEHKGRDFYEPLIKYMVSAPIVVLVLSGEDAIVKNRALIGATDPAKAEANTIRADYALSVRENSVHGSDSPESADREIAFFFNEDEICSRD